MAIGSIRGGRACSALVMMMLAAGQGNMDFCENSEKQGYHLLETQVLSRTQATTLEDVGENWDFWKWPREGTAALILSTADDTHDVEDALRRVGIQFSEKPFNPSVLLLNHDRDGKPCSGFFCRYLHLEEIYNYLDDLGREFSDIVTVKSIGSTVMGHDLKVIRITNGREGGENNEKTRIVIDAGIHGREWIGPHAALYIIVQLVENYTANRELLNGVEWYIFPVFNPDGYGYTFNTDRFWRKTWSFNGDSDCLGVDIDRNFPFHWGESGVSNDPCSPVFGGHESFSEVETVAFASFIRGLGPTLRLYLSLRGHGPLLLFPWDYTSDEPKDANELREAAETAVSALETVRGTKYIVGSAANVNYKSSRTAADWMKEMVGVKYVYTLFLPPGASGFDPLPNKILPVVQETFEAIKILSLATKGTENHVN